MRSFFILKNMERIAYVYKGKKAFQLLFESIEIQATNNKLLLSDETFNFYHTKDEVLIISKLIDSQIDISKITPNFTLVLDENKVLSIKY